MLQGARGESEISYLSTELPSSYKPYTAVPIHTVHPPAVSSTSIGHYTQSSAPIYIILVVSDAQVDIYTTRIR